MDERDIRILKDGAGYKGGEGGMGASGGGDGESRELKTKSRKRDSEN